MRRVPLLLGLLLSAAPVWSQQVKAGDERAPARPSCVIVEVDGRRVGAADCAARKLEAAARAAQSRAKADPSLAVPHATSSDLTVGVGNVAASSQRLGGDLRGATRLPVRVTPPPATSPSPR